MANLQVRSIDSGLYEALRARASNHRRSISQEVVLILQDALQSPPDAVADATREFLRLSWEDARPATAIVRELKNQRTSKRRFVLVLD